MSRISPRNLIFAAAAASITTFAMLPASAEQAPAPSATEAPAPSKPERKLPIHMQVMFNLVDANGDGFVEESELAALQKALFTAIDTDKDGKLSQKEFRAMLPGGGDRGARFGRMMQHGGPGFHQGGPRGPHFGRGGPRGEEGRGPRPQRHGAMDGENAAPGKAHNASRGFAAMDANGDGVVTAEEFAKAKPRMPFLNR